MPLKKREEMREALIAEGNIFGWSSAADTGEDDLLDAAMRVQRETAEACCRAVCVRCGNNTPEVNSHGDYWHEINNGVYWCHAGSIRSEMARVEGAEHA